jgi:4-diphosphocytidyl-2-C-methyl-D-erythritol kinase
MNKISAGAQGGIIKIPACAKINLTLDVGGLRPDGYHEVASVMQTISLADTLLLSKATAGITVSCDTPGVPVNEGNLAYKALALLVPQLPGGVKLEIKKRIPLAAGLGGGSSDAAAALKGVCALYNLGLSELELLDAAARVGSDVSFFLLGGTALAEGRGEVVTRLPSLPVFWLVLVKPGFGVSTADVYRHYRQGKEKEHTPPFIAALESGLRGEILSALGNHLESVTFDLHPELAAVKKRLLDLGALRAVLAGSGPTVYGIFSGKAEASLAAKKLREENPDFDVLECRTVSSEEIVEGVGIEDEG